MGMNKNMKWKNPSEKCLFDIAKKIESYSIEDQLKIFILDTERIFKETYQVWSDTNKFYNYSISAYYPNTKKLENFL